MEVGYALKVSAIVLATFSTTSVVGHLGHEFKHRHSHIDMRYFSRLLLPSAFILCIAQSVVKLVQVWTDPEDCNAWRFEYAGDILYMGALLVLKLNCAYLGWAILERSWLDCCYPVIIAGMTGFFMCTIVQCRPMLWQSGTASCLAQPGFWTALGCFDIISDLCLTSIFVGTIYRMEWEVLGRRKLCTTLGARMVPLVFAVARLPLIRPASVTGRFTTPAYRLDILTQFQLHLGATCLMVGRVAHLLSAAERGWRRTTSLRGQPQMTLGEETEAA